MGEQADKAVREAQDVRAFHRKRTYRGHLQRETDVRHALSKLRQAMKPIRSELGRVHYRPATPERLSETAELKRASRAIQAERRKLWKLRGPPPGR